jgi:transcriptional regulator of acetoin/glycerol metabolism
MATYTKTRQRARQHTRPRLAPFAVVRSAHSTENRIILKASAYSVDGDPPTATAISALRRHAEHHASVLATGEPAVEQPFCRRRVA